MNIAFRSIHCHSFISLRAASRKGPSISCARRQMSTQKTSHLERTAAEPRARELYDVKLARIDQVNERVRLFRLELLDGPVKFLAGQWLDTYVPDVAKAGGFTITSAPSAASSAPTGTSPYLELAVQESPENAPAAWLWRSKEDILGATLRVRIGGSFVFPPPSGLGDTRRVVLVAGGVGVNPLMSMLSLIAENKEDAGGLEVRMAYGSKVPSGGVEKILFLDRITKIFGEKKVQGSVDLFVTGESQSSGESQRRHMNDAALEIHHRRIAVRDLRDLVGPEENQKSTLVYLCGPPAMTDGFAAALTSKDGLGLDSKQVMTEKWW